MFFVSIPTHEDLQAGAKVRINGEEVTIRREGKCLVYTDGDSKENRCEIMRMVKNRLPDRTGRQLDCWSFTCASDGQKASDCHIISPRI